MEKPIYLDYASSTPVSAEVIEAMNPYLDKYFGNPACPHLFGAETKSAIELSRKQVAGLLNCRSDEIVFTSGVTESNNHAIKGTAFAYREKGNHIIITSIEHPSISKTCAFLERQGFRVTSIPVDKYGTIDFNALRDSITERTILVSVMHANNQIGTIQPVEKIAELTKSRGVLFHSDAAQSVGKIPIDLQSLGVDLLSLSGHKLYAPKGTGVLYIRSGVHPESLMHGSRQEGNRRSGTENVPGIVGLGKTCEIALRNMEKNAEKMKKMRDMLYNGLRERIKEIRLNGHPEQRLPDILNVSFKGMMLEELYGKIKDRVAITPDASYVLDAIKLPEEWKKCTVRFSVGKHTTEDEILKAILVFEKTLKGH